MGKEEKKDLGEQELMFPKIFLVMMRTTLLLGLILATIIVPVSGFTSYSRIGASTEQVAGIKTEGSWAGLRAEKAKNELNLSDNPTAAVRSRILALKDNCEIKDLGSGNISSDYKNKDNLIIFPLPRGSFQASSPFGYRSDPISGKPAMHTGQDYSAPAGTPIRAVAKGKVIKSGKDISGANGIVIEHNIKGEHFYSVYYHMLDGSLRVYEGQEIEVGKLIGLVGSTGYSTGNHLHLEIHISRRRNAVDPVAWLNKHDYVYYGELCD